MPKRAHSDEPLEDRWLRKKRKYEKKLEAKKKRDAVRRIIYSEDEELAEIEGQSREFSGMEFAPNVLEGISLDNIESPITEPALSANASVTSPAPPAPAPAPEPCDINPDVDVVAVESVEDFDPDLLRELGEADTEPVEYGEGLQDVLASKFQKILLNGLKKETKDDLLGKYLYPKNVPLAKGPTLNPEIGAMLPETCRQRDKRLLAKQDQLGRVLSALGKGLSILLKRTPDIPEVVRILNNAGLLLADSHYNETDTRRSVILPLIDKSLSGPFKDRKRDSFLFGEKLGELVKDSRGIKRTGQLIQASISSTSNLNGRGSSSRVARQQRGGQAYAYRAGGLKPTMSSYPYPNRRRAAAPLAPLPPPPLLPHRRAPAPPPPPRRGPPLAQRPATSR